MKRTVLFAALLATAATLGGARTAGAQLFTPSYMAPLSSSDFGAYLGHGLAFEGIVRRSLGAFDLGVRGGIVDVGETAAALLGGEFLTVLTPEDAAVSIAGTAAGQTRLGRESAIGLEGGLSIGTSFQPEGLRITPYLHPRLGFVSAQDPEGVEGQRTTTIDLHIDLGADFEIGNHLIVRLGVGFTRVSDGVGVGIAWR